MDGKQADVYRIARSFAKLSKLAGKREQFDEFMESFEGSQIKAQCDKWRQSIDIMTQFANSDIDLELKLKPLERMEKLATVPDYNVMKLSYQNFQEALKFSYLANQTAMNLAYHASSKYNTLRPASLADMANDNMNYYGWIVEKGFA
jgi:CTP synthase (UTP-ammonia lyase)